MYQPLDSGHNGHNGHKYHSLGIVWKNHVYKLIGILVILLIFVQYLSNFLITSEPLSEMPTHSLPSKSDGFWWPVRSSIQSNGSSSASGSASLLESMDSENIKLHPYPQERSLSFARIFPQSLHHFNQPQPNLSASPLSHHDDEHGDSNSSSLSSSILSSHLVPTAQMSTFQASQSSHSELCSVVPPRLVGKLKVLRDIYDWSTLEGKFPQLMPGGCFKNTECKARQKVALIIPYRHREDHLKTFLNNIHPILLRQQVDYCVYVIEQIGNTSFNRAKLFNIGFNEAIKQNNYDCFIFHDVDLIPEDDRNIYRCTEQPRHMSVAIDTMKYRLPYESIFGGVSALSRDQLIALNGFSNEYWGWGGEDDDMSRRILYGGFRISRPPAKYARYTMLRHVKDAPNPDRLICKTFQCQTPDQA
ncbi:beta-1,4-N-acetylgalactosaminyltransferase bre-4-like isoform X2 [Brevipalpus obovatus]|uniref:beta-1,4-N-acetylgalactosaminyltransferase bre-4-like isoform X2 n=1 Tax=Brevipalpus obovatus TaxID=246614 RepID=UPI003D9E0C06